MLTLKQTRIDSILTLTISGIMDYSTIHHFNEPIEDETSLTRIILDFAELEFIDSTGIGAVLEVIYTGSARRIIIEFQGLSQETRALFETVGVFQILEVLQGERER